MNRLTYWGLVLAALALAAYLAMAMYRKKQANLASAVNIIVAVVSAIGAVRLVGFVFSDHFEEAVIAAAKASNGSVWSLSPDDVIFLFIGGVALAWVSWEALATAFKDVRS